MLFGELEFVKETLPFWKDLDAGQKRFMEVKLIERCYGQGQNIHNGEDCTGLLLVKNGQLRSFILSESGKEITLFRLFERDVCILSSSCMMRNITFDIHIEAEKNSEILIMPAGVFKQLSDANPAVKDFQTEIISARLSDVMWVMEQVVFMSMDKRLATFLLEQSSIEGSDELTITHETIARNMGTAREVVSRMLKYFENEGLVALTRGRITLTDRKRLMKCAVD
ncbi:MAG: Crp/Fnr family transcriptional regulator [Caldicoprobacterales bacterium]|nr:Crp/Fnr family transcriptional regulator [Clostridiales bacterium]